MYKISVLVLVYNQENYILDNLKAIDKQIIDAKVEVVICNDCSTDNTRSVIEGFLINKQNINIDFKLVNHSINKGMQQNFFWGFNQCKGEFIAICDGDDFWLNNNKLNEQLQILIGNNDIGLVFSDAYWFDQVNKKNAELPDKNRLSLKSWGSLEDYVEQGSDFLNSPTFMFKKSLVDVINDVSIIENTLWDLYIVLSILQKNAVLYYMDYKTAVYRILQNSVSHSDNRAKQFAFFKKKLNTELYFVKNKNLINKIRTKFYISYFDCLGNCNFIEKCIIFYLCYNKKSKLKLVNILFKLKI
jgi:glycosyltransferase involved in cell wall biosynthesis